MVTGISIFKTTKLTESKEKTVDSKFVATVCVKNKLAEKITVKLEGKELVVQNDGKECVFEIPKGITLTKLYSPIKKFLKKGNINLKMK